MSDNNTSEDFSTQQPQFVEPTTQQQQSYNNFDVNNNNTSSGSSDFFIQQNEFLPMDNNNTFSSPTSYNMNYIPPSFNNQFNPNQIYHQASNQFSPQQQSMNFMNPTMVAPPTTQTPQSLQEMVEQNSNYIPPEKRVVRPLPLSPFMEGFDSMEQIQKQLAIKKAIETMTESCVSKSVFAAVAGTVLGGAFGIISASFTLENTYMKTPQQIIREESMTSREKIREYFRDTKTRCVSMGKSFGAVGALYSFFECSLEKVRGKKDVKGSFMAGCISGAVLARKAGIGPIVLGCATFGAFSSAIDYYTEYT